jgi:nucleotide-binding universal stress UspA family protein
MFRHILIAYDESKEAQRALDKGLELAVELHAEVTLLTVEEPLPSYVQIAASVMPTLPEEQRRMHRESFRAMHERARERATSFGVTLRSMLMEGSEVKTILETASQVHADLLVVGLRRHLPGVELAGTVRNLSNGCPCPILAVPSCAA